MKIEVITEPIDDKLAAILAQIQFNAYVTSGMRSYTQDEIFDLLSLESYTLYLAQRNFNDQSTVDGFLIEQHAADEVEVITVAIEPAHQRQKVGKALFSALIEKKRKTESVNIFLEVAKINHSAIAFYERMGFEIIGTRKGYYTIKSSLVDAIVMRKRD